MTHTTMDLAEAVRQARKELGLSQMKLAERAGMQRRQLATLEQGGNVTLRTIRKVLGQLPNLEGFMLDGVYVDTRRSSGDVSTEFYGRMLSVLGLVLVRLAQAFRAGVSPARSDMRVLEKIHAALGGQRQD